MVSCCRSSSLLLVVLLLHSAIQDSVVQGFRSASPLLVSVGSTKGKQQQQQEERRGVVGPLFAIGTTTTATDIIATKSATWNDLTTKLPSLKSMDTIPNANGAADAYSTLTDTIQSLLQQSLDKGQLLLQHINELFVSILSSLTSIIPSSGININNNNNNFNFNFDIVSSSIQPILEQFKETVVSIGILSNDDAIKVIHSINTAFGALNTPESIIVSAIISYVVINSVMTWGESPPPGKPYPKGKYDPIAARIYFDSRPLQVLSRSLTITFKSLSFALQLAQDKFIGGEQTWQKNQEQRGLELAQLLTELGPTFIKSKSN
jgi:hypothetical protein